MDGPTFQDLWREVQAEWGPADEWKRQALTWHRTHGKPCPFFVAEQVERALRAPG